MVLLAPPLRFGPQPLAGKRAKPVRAEGRQKPTAARATRRKAEAQKTSHSIMPSYRRHTFQSVGRSSLRKLSPLRKSSQPLARRPRSCAAVKAAKRSQAPALISPPLARKVPKSGKGSQTLSRKRPISDDMLQVFDGSLSEAQHLERHAACKGFCIRCDLQKRPKVYEACTLYEGRSWLSRGVNRGIWGLGCRICAEFAASGNKCDGARFSKFAKFQIRPKTGFHARMLLERHTSSTSHRVACGIKKRKGSDMLAQPTAPQPLACPTVWPTERPCGMRASGD